MGSSTNSDGRKAAEDDIRRLELAAGAAGRLANWDQGPKFLDIAGAIQLAEALQSLHMELARMPPILMKLSGTRTAQSRSSDRKNRQ